MESGGSSDSEEYLTPEEEMAGEEQEKGMSTEKDTSQTRERGSRRGQKKHGERMGGKANSPNVPVKQADKTVEGIANIDAMTVQQKAETETKGSGKSLRVELGGTEEEAPVPPPRRKRKKKQFQKQSSLEDLDQLPLAPFQRSLTIGSIDMSREASAGRIRDSPLKGSPRTKSPPGNVRIPPRERREAPSKVSEEESKSPSLEVTGTDEKAPNTSREHPTKSPSLEVTGTNEKAPNTSRGHPTKSPSLEVTGTDEKAPNTSRGHPTKVDAKVKAMLRTRTSESPESEARAATPAILIEPNTSLELTEDMISSGESEVITTAADTPLAKARRSSGDPMVKVIFPSDDESDGPDEDVDGGVRGEDGGARKKGVMRAEGGGGTKAKTEKRSRPYGSPTDESKILEKTMIKNLDTGEAFPLSAAEERIPRGWGLNPLSEHLIRRTNELALGDSRSHSMDELEDGGDDSQHRRKPLKKKLKHLFGKRKEGRHVLEGALPSDEELMPPSHSHTHTHPHAHGTERDKEQELKYKPSSHYKGPLDFDKVRLKQDLSGHHLGAVWVMEFSICGRLLATAGQDSVVRVWVLRTAYQFFHELQAKYQRFGVHSSGDSLSEKASVASTSSSKSSDPDEESKMAFQEQPLCSYCGHQADILDVSWSKNFFLLSSSMDKTVRLWHISRKECLCCFQHVDFVTAIAFHPRDDRYFLSGSLDGKIRLWNIPDKRVALWNEIEFVGSRLITAANFCMNGKLAVAGTYDGRCIFYETEHLKYHTQIQVRSRHGKNKGRKISGVEPLPGEDKLLVTSNDSRTRLYNLKDHSLSCKYKGGLNTSSQIKSTFSRDGQYIISGSEDNYIYIWKTHHDVSKLSSARRDRNEYYESFGAHSAPVTAAVFAPVPGITVDEGLKEVGQMIIAADYQGCIKVYVNSEQL